MRKRIVISAVNLTEAGQLSILKDSLQYLADNLIDNYNIIALVHDRALVNIDKIEYYEFPNSKKHWIKRLYYEYIYFKWFSKKIKPYLWFSLQDITANVDAEIQAVYCHHSSPFYRLSLKEAWFDPKLALFNKFYKFLYKINIKKNTFIVVQQQWLKREFEKLFAISDNIIVAYPDIKHIDVSSNISSNNQGKKIVFLYPSFPRVFKNFELICEATKQLNDSGIKNFEVYLTINGKETRYSKWIYNKYQYVPSLRFIGLQTREKVFLYYNESQCLIFPSRLETWGMPITEFKTFNKPIFVANSRYANETIGKYNKVRFFNPDDPIELSNLMKEFINNTITYEQTRKIKVEEPFAENWQTLFKILLKENNALEVKR